MNGNRQEGLRLISAFVASNALPSRENGNSPRGRDHYINNIWSQETDQSLHRNEGYNSYKSKKSGLRPADKEPD